MRFAVLSVLICVLQLQSGNVNADEYDDPDNHIAIKNDKKTLVLFAGPHNSASSSVEDFFHQWAEKGWMKGHPKTVALQYWRWPHVHGKYGTHGPKVFGKLVTSPEDDAIEDEILKDVKKSWDESGNGIILGTEEFDQVGPDATYDALTAMKKIVAHLKISDPKDVTVVVNYRAPRLDQWVSMWKHADGDFEDSTYEDFLCLSHTNEDSRAERYDMLGSKMNPLNAAQHFLQQGWKVKVIDMSGVDKDGKDIAHTIGCQVLKGKCQNGFLTSLDGQLPHSNAIDKPFDELNDEESAKMEELFLNRDCGYKWELQSDIKSGQLEIIHQHTLWSVCEDKRRSYYEELVGATSALYQAFLSQLECSDNPHGLHEGVGMDKALGRRPSFFRLLNGFFEAVLVPLVFLGGVAYVIMTMVKGAEQRRLNERAQAVAHAEMTPYPSSAFQDGHDHEEETRDTDVEEVEFQDEEGQDEEADVE